MVRADESQAERRSERQIGRARFKTYNPASAEDVGLLGAFENIPKFKVRDRLKKPGYPICV